MKLNKNMIISALIIISIILKLTACATPKSEIRNIIFQESRLYANNDYEDVVVYELLEPMKSYCDFYYDTTNFISEDTAKSNEKFFNYGTCFFNIKEWKKAPSFTFRYTTIPNQKNMIICEFSYRNIEVDDNNCTKLNDYASSIYHTIPENAWKTYTINTQEIIKNSIQDNDPIGERPSYFRSNWQRIGKERDRYVELQFYTGIVDGKIEHRLDVGNYWKYQRNTSWN